MARLLTEQELQDIRDSGSAYGLALAASTRRLLDHIEAQEAECAAMRQALEALAAGQDTEGASLASLLDVRRVTSIALSGTAGQALLDELARLRLALTVVVRMCQAPYEAVYDLSNDVRLVADAALRSAGYLKEEVE